jgi:hypothetical protein
MPEIVEGRRRTRTLNCQNFVSLPYGGGFRF